MTKVKVLIPFLSMFALASCSLIPGFNPISSDVASISMTSSMTTVSNSGGGGQPPHH